MRDCPDFRARIDPDTVLGGLPPGLITGCFMVVHVDRVDPDIRGVFRHTPSVTGSWSLACPRLTRIFWLGCNKHDYTPWFDKRRSNKASSTEFCGMLSTIMNKMTRINRGSYGRTKDGPWRMGQFIIRLHPC